MLKTLHFLLGMALILNVWSCDRPAPASKVVVPTTVAAIHVVPEKLSLAVGQTQQFSAMLGDAAGNLLQGRNAVPSLVIGQGNKPAVLISESKGRAGRIVTWSSSQPSRARIDPGGLVTALAIGESTITATCEGQSKAVTLVITEPQPESVMVAPRSANLEVGETLQLKATLRDGGGKGATTWRSEQPSLATVGPEGLVTATAAGTATIIATSGDKSGKVILSIVSAETINGLDFPGNAGVNTTMRFEFIAPPAAYPATYIWRVYPRQQQSYYTAFFWGNNGGFHPSSTYYGFHPYPDWNTAHQHFWEIAAPPGGDFVSPSHVVYDRWYIQVAICKEFENTTVHEYYWDWPDTTKVVRHTGVKLDNPPVPGLVVGDAPWNQGQEVWDGVLRGFQFYDVAMTHSEIEQEIASPGSKHTPWYLNRNPTPKDISDKSGRGHHPVWVGHERPSLWTGAVHGGVIIRTVVPPR